MSGDLPYSRGVTVGGEVYVNVPIEQVPEPTGFDPALSIQYSPGGEPYWLVEAVPRYHLGYGWQFVGPGARRLTDEASGIVTYYQYRLDIPHFAEKSAEYRYNGRFGQHSEVIFEREIQNAAYVVDHGNATTVWPYATSETAFLYSQGVLKGVVQRRDVPTFEDSMAKEITRSAELGQGVQTSGGGAYWGDVPNHTLTGVRRQDERTIDLTK